MSLLKQAMMIKDSEKLEQGSWDFTLDEIVSGETEKSKKRAVFFIGRIINSKGKEQTTKVAYIMETEDQIKFNFVRFIEMLTSAGVSIDENISDNDFLNLLPVNLVGKKFVLTANPVKVNGVTMTEKVLKYVG